MAYKRILTTSPIQMINSLKSMYEQYLSIREISLILEENALSVPSLINIDVPNISFFAGGEYDPIKKEVSIVNKTKVYSSGGKVSISGDGSSSTITSETVLPVSDYEEGVNPLSKNLLKRGSPKYAVSWMYDTDKISTSYENPSIEIPSYRYGLNNRFGKQGDNIPNLVAVHEKIEDGSVVNLGILEGELNRLDSGKVLCNPDSLVGSSLTSSKDTTTIKTSDTKISCDVISIERRGPVVENSIVSTKEGDKNFTLSSLENARYLHIDKVVPVDSDDVVSSSFLDSRSLEMIPLESEIIPYESKVYGGSPSVICNAENLSQILKNRVSELYLRLLEEKIKGTDSSTIGELVIFIELEIDKIKEENVSRDICDDYPLVDINQSCDTIPIVRTPYEDIKEYMPEPNRMATRDRFINIIVRMAGC